jgi:hypothetical protein
MPHEPVPAAKTVRGVMPTIWGHLEKVDELSVPAPNIQVRSILSDGTVLRVRANIGAQTIIARGIESVDMSDLRKGEFVEVSYRHGREGWLDADTVYVRPEQAAVGQDTDGGANVSKAGDGFDSLQERSRETNKGE